MSVARRGSATSGNYGNTTTWPITMPSGVQAGDDLFVAIVRDNNVAPVVTPPAGFSLLGADQYDNNCRIEVWRKISDGTEGASVTFTLSVAEFGTWGCVAYTGADQVTPEDLATTTFNVNGPTTTPAQTAQVTVSANAMVVGFFGHRGDASSSGTTLGGATEVIDFVSTDNVFLYVEELVQVAPGSVALSYTNEISDTHFQGVQVTVRPAASAAAPSLRVVTSTLRWP